MNEWNWLGSVAAVLTTASFVPQVLKVVRERQTAGISLAMYAIFVVGLTLWCFYGLLVGSWPVFAANSVTLLLSAVILVMKIRLG